MYECVDGAKLGPRVLDKFGDERVVSGSEDVVGINEGTG